MALPEEIKYPHENEAKLFAVHYEQEASNANSDHLPEGEVWMSARERLRLAALTVGFLAVSASLEASGNQIASDATFILGLGGVATQNFEMYRRVRHRYNSE